jgi:predicted phosphodiesterase
LIHTLGEKDYIFRDSKVDLQDNSFIGHSHQQYIRYFNNFFLGNPGSIGQNRNFINISNYIIWDTESGEFQMKSLPYDLDYLLIEMEKRKYPVECIDYYRNKKKF